MHGHLPFSLHQMCQPFITTLCCVEDSYHFYLKVLRFPQLNAAYLFESFGSFLSVFCRSNTSLQSKTVSNHRTSKQVVSQRITAPWM
jgi:hypothetical protein